MSPDSPPASESSHAPHTVVLPDERCVDWLAEHGGDLSDWHAVVWDGEGEPPAEAQDARVLLGPYMGAPWSAGSLAALPGLELLQLMSAGVDGWVDRVPEGVALANGRGVHGGSTAELAVLGVLAWRRELRRFLDQQRAEVWTTGEDKHTGDLDRCRVTVLGAGDIATYVRDALTVFGADVVMTGRTAREGVIALDDLADRLTETEAVIVAVPLSESTRGLLDAGMLGRLPDGALVVNVGRGPIVDTDALLAELRAERLHAFLDVTDPEPLPDGHPLWTAPQCTITPHVAGGTHGWVRRGFTLLGDQLRAVAAGEEPTNLVREG